MIALNNVNLQNIDINELVEQIADRVAEKLASRLPMRSDERLIDRVELAKELDCGIATIDRRVRDGSVPFYRSGRQIRFRLTEVLEAIQNTPEIVSAP